jgi:CheY-like chemotaxis protein
VKEDRLRLPLSDEQEALLFQSVRELLMNAVKHARTDSATITLSRSDSLIRLVVQDQGCGFDPIAMPAADPLSTQFGLFSIQERMQALGGRFILVSESGWGTTATLTLPLTGVETGMPLASPHTNVLNTEPVDREPVSLNGSRLATHVPDIHNLQDVVIQAAKIRVLLVDDHTMIRAGLKTVLLEYSAIDIVGEAVNGVEAIALTRSLQPEIVVMDVTMPIMNGIEATRLIKQEFPSVIVIGLSVHSSVQVKTAMKEAGAARVLTKESALDTLLRTICETWEGQSRRRRQKMGEAGAIVQ